MSSQIIPLKLVRIPPIGAEFWLWRLFAFELQRRGYGCAEIFSKRSARTLAIMHLPIETCGQGNGGLIVTSSGRSIQYRDFIIAQASQHGLPAVYCASAFVKRGGLISYGPNRVEQFQRVAAYISRILNGEKPANLPVQAPTKYELVVNFKAGKALGFEIPSSVLARADEVEAPCL
jgi:putative ABC transport system substrate-binding protein